MDYNKNQLDAINHFTGNCVVLASAGSGKTSVLVERIKRLITNHSIPEESILALTFSKKASQNMRQRLGEKFKDVTIDTFHALGYKLMKEQRVINYNVNLLKEWEKKKIIFDICVKSLRLEHDERNVDVNAILGFIALQKNHLLKPCDDLISSKLMPYIIEQMQQIYELYEIYKNKNKKIDFDDMIINSYYMLHDNEDIRKFYQNRYKFILVDEMQDTNEAQYKILKILGETNNNLFVVGDPLQCIYEWRGCNNDYIINFQKDWKETKVINLNINYRSSQDIVKLANQLVVNTKETRHPFYLESESYNDKFKKPKVKEFINESEEASYICEKIKILNEKYKYKDIAILTRTNFQMQILQMMLYEKAIPYKTVDGQNFYELKEIQDMISFLKVANDKNDNESFIKIYNTPNRYLGKVFLDELSKYAKSKKLSLYDSLFRFPRSQEWRYKNGISELYNLIDKISKMKKYNVGQLISLIRKDLKYDVFISKEMYENNDKNEKLENLDRLILFASNFKSLSNFLKEVDEMLKFNQKDSTGDEDEVNLMTIHKSKGLEFPVVFISGVNNDILPHSLSDNLNEERRLLYVAITRAEKELFISSTETYNNKVSGASDFIKDIFNSMKKYKRNQKIKIENLL